MHSTTSVCFACCRCNRGVNPVAKTNYGIANDYSHIQDPNLRRRLALSEIDKTPFGSYRSSPLYLFFLNLFLFESICV